jgi:hypothetical protein
MLVVNLYADHFLVSDPNHPVRTAEEFWYDTQKRPALYQRAAKAVGLTPAEYKEFLAGLVAGNYVHVKLPRRLDAMSGNHKGYVYAVRNAIIQPLRGGGGWPTGLRVTLADRTVVYIPDLCSNLSVNHPPQIASLPKAPPAGGHMTLAMAVAPADQPVVVQPPDVPTVPTIAQAVPAVAARACSWWCFAVPLLGGTAAAIDDSKKAPPCSLGSNSDFACSK